MFGGGSSTQWAGLLLRVPSCTEPSARRAYPEEAQELSWGALTVLQYCTHEGKSGPPTKWDGDYVTGLAFCIRFNKVVVLVDNLIRL